MWIWLGIGLALLALEFCIPGVFVCFFGCSALLVSLLLWIFPRLELSLQLIIFAVGGLLVVLLVKKLFPGLNPDRSNAIDQDEVAGCVAVVCEDICPPLPGKVEFRGSFWTAESAEKAVKGDKVRIQRRRNIVLEVEKIQ